MGMSEHTDVFEKLPTVTAKEASRSGVTKADIRFK
jgi:hypothetical protein